MTVEELRENLISNGFENSVIFNNPDYADAVIGIDTNDSVVYDYSKMVECLVKEYKATNPNATDEELETEAREFIDFNTIRTLPYINNGVKPTIVFTDLLY